LAALVLEGELWAAFALRLGAMKKSMMIKEAKALETCPETGRAIVNCSSKMAPPNLIF
jgi:hypothetical protein